MKLCKDCKWCVSVGEHTAKCTYGEYSDVDYVNGGMRLNPLSQLRICQHTRSMGTTNDCGPDARWFEPKEES